KGFWRDRKDAPEGNVAMARPAPLADITDEVEFVERDDVGRMPVGMVASTATLIAASLAVTVLAGPIAGVTGRAAESAQDVTIYRSAVLGTTADNPGRTLEQQRLDDGSDTLRNRDHLLPEPEPAVQTATESTEEAQP
ncbi:MAG TPA: Na+/H+ antiporter subunit D, partial [Corynebacterium pollutisoli]|nr:Na+/H+ antiporter subunit D [Corynebacterium pollutisoli]